MTFDEATESINALLAFSTVYGISPTVYGISPTVVRDIISKLKEEYAPTVEMTKNQYLFITIECEKESVVEAVANLTVDDIIKEKFHSNFWEPLSEKQVVKAWLYPETIKVVD